jgi:hypothetical protein
VTVWPSFCTRNVFFESCRVVVFVALPCIDLWFYYISDFCVVKKESFGVDHFNCRVKFYNISRGFLFLFLLQRGQEPGEKETTKK